MSKKHIRNNEVINRIGAGFRELRKAAGKGQKRGDKGDRHQCRQHRSRPVQSDARHHRSSVPLLRHDAGRVFPGVGNVTPI